MRHVGPVHISLLDWCVALVAAEFVVAPLATLAHELGHAWVALRLTSGRVIVHVGRPSMALGVDFERLMIRWSPVPARGVEFRGVCIWDAASATPRDRFQVTIAGPLVTVSLIPLFVLGAFASAGGPDWIPATFGLSALGAFISCLVNLDPRPANATERAAPGRSRRDGPKAIAAYRAWRGVAAWPHA